MNPYASSRRDFLQSSTLGMGWLAFSALAGGTARAQAASTHFPARAKRVIFLTMKGGPSHVDLLDYKGACQGERQNDRHC